MQQTNVREVLDCGSPLPLWRRQPCGGKSGGGPPHSKTLPRHSTTQSE